MKKLVLFSLLLLTSCASLDAVTKCREKAGPKPYAAADVFGIFGMLAVDSYPERKAWYKSVDDCMAKWRKDNP